MDEADLEKLEQKLRNLEIVALEDESGKQWGSVVEILVGIVGKEGNAEA